MKYLWWLWECVAWLWARKPASSAWTRLTAWLATEPRRTVVIGRFKTDPTSTLHVCLGDEALSQHVTAVGDKQKPGDLIDFVFVEGNGGSLPSADQVLVAALDEWERRYAT